MFSSEDDRPVGVAVHYDSIVVATMVKIVRGQHLKRVLWLCRWYWWLGGV